MDEDNVVSLRRPEDREEDPLTEVLRHGARTLLAQAIEAESRRSLRASVVVRRPARTLSPRWRGTSRANAYAAIVQHVGTAGALTAARGLPAAPGASKMPKEPDGELEFRLLEAASRIKKDGSIDVQGGFDGFDLREVNRAVQDLTDRGLLRSYDARRFGGGHWYIMALTAAGHAELQARRWDRARWVARAWCWLVRLDWTWGLPVLIAAVGLFALGLMLPQLGAILLSVLLG